MYISRPYGYSYPQYPGYSSYGQTQNRQYTPAPTAGGKHLTGIAAKARAARLRGMQDGGPVDDFKPSSDQSGATGSNDYYSALGYDESS